MCTKENKYEEHYNLCKGVSKETCLLNIPTNALHKCVYQKNENEDEDTASCQEVEDCGGYLGKDKTIC